jgi:hypothetical protein
MSGNAYSSVKERVVVKGRCVSKSVVPVASPLRALQQPGDFGENIGMGANGEWLSRD